MRDGFIKVAAAAPKIKVADTEHNASRIIKLCREAAENGVKILAFPELCITGYTCGDLFLQPVLLDGAREALFRIMAETAELDMVIAVGLPLLWDGKLFNCAALVSRGELISVTPKTYLPNYGEFYEKRWFSSPAGMGPGVILEIPRPEGDALRIPMDCPVVDVHGIDGLRLGVELCEDLWAMDPPSRALAEMGANVILNLSASNELVGKAQYRRELVKNQSARLLCGYIYAGAGEGESTTDVVFSGHCMVAEDGVILAESRFKTGLTVTELDIERLNFERRRLTTVAFAAAPGRSCSVTPAETQLTRKISPTPFVPQNKDDRDERCREILNIQALGLKKRIEHTNAKTVAVGISGGLDSTLAMLVAARAMDMLERPRTDITAVTMPCFGTTRRTRSNAEILAEKLGARLITVDITEAVNQHFKDIGHDPENLNVVFENSQARERTQVLMDIANGSGGLVIGTGDLSELALGWATYNGDHMSMYGVNVGVPKTLVRYLVAYEADICGDAELASALRSILDTPVSPELLPAENGEISQKTEDLVGPYELHDFFLYYLIRWGFSPKKVLRMAVYAFSGCYDRETILKWLRTFIRRFFSQQFKRSCLPDGPKVGTLTLSPRGDWRMPSDASPELWLRDLQ